uniref:NADH dehydrogenase [ubiquinone] 1 beta subcomplex subunit 11, mitochondrial n=1 Tax=Mesocestoides corti TaxID=53468 RepID=A0A5K3FEK3_MESCO
MYPRLFLPLVVRRVGVFRLNLSSPQLRTFNTSLPAFSSGPSFKNILQKNDLPDDVKKGIESEARDMLKVILLHAIIASRIGFLTDGTITTELMTLPSIKRLLFS